MFRLNCLVLIFCLSSSYVYATGATSLSATRQTELQHLLKHDCGSCHGMTLKGGLGTPLLPKNLAHLSIEAIQASILHGRAGTAMPGWKAMLSTEDAHWLAIQLKQGTLIND